MKKIDDLLTMVWVSIHVQPKLPLRVHRFGQNSSKKVLPCNHFGTQQPLDFGF